MLENKTSITGTEKYLNLGCGSKFHPFWINVDMYAVDESVLTCNFLNGIPFESNYFDVVYHSHVLEHFTPEGGNRLIQECFRVLKPGGVIRMAFPNLEKIVNEYTINLKRIDNKEPEAESDYDWIMLEMYDQTVRNTNGGEMIKYLKDTKIKNKEYVLSRIGDENFFTTSDEAAPQWVIEERIKLKNKIVNAQKKSEGGEILIEKLKNLKDRILISLLSEKEKIKLEIGNFRTNGEVHQWMYDRFSIKRLLEKAGFEKSLITTAEESYIEGWKRFKLDNPFENSSLFVEAIKPINTIL